MTPHVRPVCLPPIVGSANTPAFTCTPAVILRHPGYGTDNILLTLPAVDGAQPVGLHQRTVLTACAIIADNAFGDVYLTRDRAGTDRIDATLPPDGLIEPGEYWLQLRGHQPVQDSTRVSSMPPPASPRPVSTPRPLRTSIQSSKPSSTDSTPQTPTPYSIVPSFADWQFPHGRVPAEWSQCHLAPQPPTPTPASSHLSSSPSRRCWITGYHMGLNECHIVPQNQEAWWAANSMRQYTMNTDGISKDAANIALLRADVHQVFDGHKFAIVPKPSTAPSKPASPPSSGSESTFAFAAHVLESDYEAREFYALYHNIAIAQAGVDSLGPEFLFARFAWAIFAHLQTFLNSSITRRHLVVPVRNETTGDRYTELKQMDGQQWTRHLSTRGQTRSGSKLRKRSSSQMTQDGPDTDDAYQERWERRSRSRGEESSEEDLDPEMRRIRRNTWWYEEVGQSSQTNLEQEQLERNTRWYEEVGRFARAASDREVRSETDGSEHDPDSDCARGRGRHRGPSPPSLNGMPHLSRSFTTHGSNRSSSTFADSSGCEDNGAGEGIHGSTAPRAKSPKAVDEPPQDNSLGDEDVLPL